MKPSLLPSYLALISSALLYGMLVFGGRMMGLHGFSLIEVLIVPNLIVVLVLALFSKPEFKKFYSVPLKVSILYPLTIILSQITQFTPVFMGLSVSLTVFLLYTQPLWTSLISVFFMKEKFTKKDAVIMISMVSGVTLLLAPWQNFSFSPIAFFLALSGGICMATWIVLTGSFYSKKEIKPLSMTFFTNAYQSIPFIFAIPIFMMLFPSNPEISAIHFNHSLIVMGIVFLYSISVFIGAQTLFYVAAKKVNNIHLGLVLLLEPVVATFLDVVFLNTSLTWNIFVGGALILAANAYLVLKSARNEIKE